MRAAGRGEPFLTPGAQQALIRDFLERGEQPAELTPREQEVVKLIAEAHTNKEIAEILHLSEKTVESHRGDVSCRSSACATASSWCATRSGTGWSSRSNIGGVTSRARLVLLVIGGCSPLRRAVFAAIAARDSDSNGDGRGRRGGRRRLGRSGPRSPFKGALRPEGAARRTSRCATRRATSCGSARLRGTVVVLSPMYTTCEDTCPLVAQQIRGALDDLSGDRARARCGRSR